MIAAHEVVMNALYEVTNDDIAPNPDAGVLLFPIKVISGHGFRQFDFLWLSGQYEGQVMPGATVQFNTMMPLKRVA